GRIAGATNIDFMALDFEDRIKGLDKNKPYLVHCAVGGRSSKSLATFERQQFQSIYHLEGGIKALEKAGLPMDEANNHLMRQFPVKPFHVISGPQQAAFGPPNVVAHFALCTCGDLHKLGI